MARRHGNSAQPALASLLDGAVAFALAESMLAQAHAQSILYTNAVQAQHQAAIVDLYALTGSAVNLFNRVEQPPMKRTRGGNRKRWSPVDDLLRTAHEEVAVATAELKAARQEARDAKDLAQEALVLVSGRPVVT